MTFYDNKEDETIELYQEKDNHYEIYYLSGKTISYYQNENRLKNEMLEQAMQRDDELFEKIQDKTRLSLLGYVSSFIPLIYGLKFEVDISLFIAYIYGFITLYNFKKNNKKLIELKKYRHYIELKNEIEKYKTKKDRKETIDFINKVEKYFNINKLDLYSVRDVKSLKKEFKLLKKIDL